MFEGLTPPYRTIVADPPWKYQTGKNSTQGAPRTKTSAELRYSVMTLDAIKSMPVSELVDGSAHLWLWVTNMKVPEGYEIVDAWGFEPITLVTWCKRGPGVGHYLRNNTEHVILASRGKPIVPETKPLSTWFVWPRSTHSTKPQESFDLIEQVSPSPRVELFSRQSRLGWDAWGDGMEGAA